MPIALVLALPAGAAVAAPEEGPHYRFKDGEKLAYVVEATTRIETTAYGRTNVGVMTQVIDVTWQVGHVDAAGRATITQTIDRIRFKAVSPSQTVEYDTRDGRAPDDPGAKSLAARADRMVGGRLSVTIDGRGQLTDVRLEAGRAAAGGGTGDPSSEAGFRHLMAELIPLLPEKAPAKREPWVLRHAAKVSEGIATDEMRYTDEGLLETGRGYSAIRKIGLSVTRKTESDSGEVLRSSSGSGTAYFEETSGRLEESSLTHMMEQDVQSAGASLHRKVTEALTLKLVGGER